MKKEECLRLLNPSITQMILSWEAENKAKSWYATQLSKTTQF